MIGIAASMFIMANGRIAGISGLIGSLLQRDKEGASEKVMFLAGLLVAPLLWGLYAAPVQIEFQGNWFEITIAGLLVGVGTRYGSGCTSGHGVCGISRLSPRSVAATGCFIFSGFATVLFLRHFGEHLSWAS